MHDLYLSTVIFHALCSITLFGVCAVLAVHDPLRRRTVGRWVPIDDTPRPVLPTSFALHVMHNRLVTAQILVPRPKAV